jgi:hypothetical protein
MIAKKEKRKSPDFSGTPGELVTQLDPELQFGKRKMSPYAALLDQLSKATDEAIAANKPLPGLKFAAVKAKASVWAQAKARGFKVVFAEKDGCLFVRIDGRVDAIEHRGEEIKKLLRIQPQTAMVLTNKLRANGDETVDAQGVETMLARMLRLGDVAKQEGGTWKLLAKKAA